LVVFLAVISLDFLAERLLVTCVRVTLINEWDAWGNNINEGVHSLGWEVEEEERWWKIKIVVGKYQWVVQFLRCEWTVVIGQISKCGHKVISLNSTRSYNKTWQNTSFSLDFIFI
jgi:hypothetical protein